MIRPLIAVFVAAGMTSSAALCKASQVKPQETRASIVGSKFNGRRTASGKRFDSNALTAASKTLPMGSKVTVENKKSHKKATVTITDRGPFVKGRGLDLSKAAANKIGMKGVQSVKVKPAN